MELARTYGEMKRTMTLDAIAGRVGKSPSHVSRYLQLLKLPPAAQQAITSGDLPVRDAARIWANKKSRSHTLVLPEKVDQVYRLIGEKVVITAAQAGQFTGRSIDSVRRSVGEAESRGLVECHREVRPHVWRLSAGGAARLGKSYQRRWLSASAMHQYLMRNSIELMYRKSGAFNFMDRVDLYRKGYQPGVAEHILLRPGQGSTDYTLIIIDDYEMPLKRLGRRLVRIHNPLKRYYSGVSQSWINLVSKVVIFTTNKDRVAAHKKALKAEIVEFEEVTSHQYGDSKQVKEQKNQLRKDRESVMPMIKSTQVAHVPAVLEIR